MGVALQGDAAGSQRFQRRCRNRLFVLDYGRALILNRLALFVSLAQSWNTIER